MKNIFEEVVDPAFHSCSRGLATKGFGTTPPVDILVNLQHIYGKPSYQELDAAFSCLKYSMNIIQLFKVMLILIEEEQPSFLSKPDEDRTLTKPNLIIYALIKLTKTGGMYSKCIEKCQKGHRRIG